MIGICYLQVVREIDTVRKFNQGFVMEFCVNYVIQFSILQLCVDPKAKQLGHSVML